MYQRVFISLLYFNTIIAREYLSVLVNRVEQLTRVGPFKTSDRNAPYHYIDGDRVDVLCISFTYLCTARITYNDVENIGANGDIFEISSTASDRNGVGLQTTLSQAHHNTHTACEFSCSECKIRLNITFVLQSEFNGLDLKINGFAVRYEKPLIYYKYFDNEVLSLDWNVNIKGIEFEAYREQWGLTDLQYEEIKGTHTEFIANTVYGMLYKIRNKAPQLNEVQVYFQKLNEMPRDELPLAINSSGSSLELYQYNGDQQIYYEFKHGDTMTFSCYTAHEFLVTSGNYKLRFDHKETWSEDEIVKRILFTTNDREFNCSLLTSDHIVVRQIRLYFHKNDSPRNREAGGIDLTTSTVRTSSTAATAMITSTNKPPEGNSVGINTDVDSTGNNSPNWIMPAVAGVLCVLIISIIAVWYMKKRSRTQRDPSNDNMQTHLVDNGHPSSSNLRQHEPLYSVPLDHRQDDTAYSEVYRPEAYSTGSSRQARGTTPDLNYAELDIAPSVEIAKKSDAVESPYAEVVYNAKARWRTD